jgi:hypothetical protein
MTNITATTATLTAAFADAEAARPGVAARELVDALRTVNPAALAVLASREHGARIAATLVDDFHFDAKRLPEWASAAVDAAAELGMVVRAQVACTRCRRAVFVGRAVQVGPAFYGATCAAKVAALADVDLADLPRPYDLDGVADDQIAPCGGGDCARGGYYRAQWWLVLDATGGDSQFCPACNTARGWKLGRSAA